MRRILSMLAATSFALALATVLVTGSPAQAHEGRLVAGGKYNFVVGWGDEPSYNGFKNSVQLILSDAAHKPVVDLGDTLQVEVTTGDQKVTLPIEAHFEVGEFGEPGDYRAWLVPTRAGNYTFHFTGTVHGDKIDESFTSSDTSFSPVNDVSEVQFPSKDPTTGQLAERLDRETKRVDAQLGSVRTKAKDDASGAKTLSRVALLGTGIAIGLGIAGMTRKR